MDQAIQPPTFTTQQPTDEATRTPTATTTPALMVGITPQALSRAHQPWAGRWCCKGAGRRQRAPDPNRPRIKDVLETMVQASMAYLREINKEGKDVAVDGDTDRDADMAERDRQVALCTFRTLHAIYFVTTLEQRIKDRVGDARSRRQDGWDVKELSGEVKSYRVQLFMARAWAARPFADLWTELETLEPKDVPNGVPEGAEHRFQMLRAFITRLQRLAAEDQDPFRRKVLELLIAKSSVAKRHVFGGGGGGGWDVLVLSPRYLALRALAGLEASDAAALLRDPEFWDFEYTGREVGIEEWYAARNWVVQRLFG